MKIFVLSPDSQGRIDGTVKRNLLDHIPNQVSSWQEADAVVVLISWYGDFGFNEELDQITKPIVIIDFMEFGSNWPMILSHYFGGPQEALSCILTAPWQRFDAWARSKWQDGQIKLYFLRELLEGDVSPVLKPIEFPAYMDIPPISSKKEFEARNFEIFFNWGYSHVSRPRLHADIFRAITTHGIEVISSFGELEARKNAIPSKAWVSIHTHHSVRQNIIEVQYWQEKSKITVALPGNGVKTFRHGETQGSIMALLEDKIAWSYPWIHGVNCIRMVEGHEFDCLEASTRREDLYSIYCASQENLGRYRSPSYVSEYIMPLIEASL